MYFEMIQQFHKVLGGLEAILVKASHHAERRSFDANNFLGMRLTPDMFPLARQIQIATDTAKAAAAGLSGKEPPQYEDNETTLTQFCERIRTTRTYLAGFKAADFTGADERKIKLPSTPGKGMRGRDYMLQRAIPNFYFHVTTAYGLLRQGGVDLGKKDFLGELPVIDL
ncbi:MAG TPA: DUF1993 domain-containing protein [Oligoflexus sp.]|uniref:DUF1993 domain-containing protein n=1 Tax=Oligoflexus sp. TaxID=1971216 RepID=UPI002D3C6A0B|nr:DUF1993 domain-containing protein [Oligoflexus sp.]HYX39595.1 DUF1993 domain-containing protein [Oligoflexus sp.]